MLHYSENIAYIATKRHEVQPDVYCRRLSLQVPVAVSVKASETADVFATICRIAMNPFVQTNPQNLQRFDYC